MANSVGYPTFVVREAMTMLGRSLEDRMQQSGKKLSPQSVVPWMDIYLVKQVSSMEDPLPSSKLT